jgi:two-component system nitrate/nitrite response regulator NarL
MVAVAVLSADPNLRERLEQLARDQAAVTMVGMVARSADLANLVGQKQIDVVLWDTPTRDELREWRDARHRAALLVLLDAAGPEGAADAFNAGARAVLERSAGGDEIVAAIMAVQNELVVLQPGLLAELLDDELGETLAANGSARAPLTRRELEVLAAMADGASNKAIARRLGISFHTAKFHVAAILAKLDADSRTEAVMKAAQSGLVML